MAVSWRSRRESRGSACREVAGGPGLLLESRAQSERPPALFTWLRVLVDEHQAVDDDASACLLLAGGPGRGCPPGRTGPLVDRCLGHDDAGPEAVRDPCRAAADRGSRSSPPATAGWMVASRARRGDGVGAAVSPVIGRQTAAEGPRPPLPSRLPSFTARPVRRRRTARPRRITGRWRPPGTRAGAPWTARRSAPLTGAGLRVELEFPPASQSRIPVEHRQVRIRDSEEGTPARGWAYFTYPARLTPLDTPRKVYTNPLAKSCISCEKGWIYRKNRYNDPEAGLCSGKCSSR